MNATGIEWADLVWNPTRGCSRVSPGCTSCYAERMAARFGNGKAPFARFVQPVMDAARRGWRWTGRVQLIESKLTEPLRRRRSAEAFMKEHGRKPLVFVDSMSDLFHEKLTNGAVHRVFRVMAEANWFDYVVLTKRAPRMVEICAARPTGWILPHVYLGVSVEDQERADERLPHLMKVAARGWKTVVSAEPLIGPVDLSRALPREEADGDFDTAYGYDRIPGIDFLIVGAESGPGARPCQVEWIRSLVRQAKAAGVPTWVKQDSGPKPGQQGRIPDDLWAVKERPA